MYVFESRRIARVVSCAINARRFDHRAGKRARRTHRRADIGREGADFRVRWTYREDVWFASFSDKLLAATRLLQVALGSLDQVAGFFFVDPAFLIEPGQSFGDF